ncbi:type VI secretion system Vgr family protein [Vibrio aestuarianus]|uniref:VgrG protein n=3 Tax=Vibrio aestuarianus TaxID=28171 RepID=A0ABM9FQC0_9VIBR|nr:type VI secretion system tip protein TssI/VgrG [Vibrio aestuarianus]MDE1213535.1 type VI secretion system tip protein VgrG [Vibrio aestuarianus]MDE1216696.1 type VI secretion system tip protein VgrG [Vibrio aestuarianus]MDE1227963.1 type VI secretion system tip protein VgrG [Vibrio aestuarianus]MDE1256438.1 type VI secretion system tip protein VgrG [Vibrio aestuarianus]MDE1261721.1 type VI secretion system tip protein VgrG [Vibrio aestuarianus]
MSSNELKHQTRSLTIKLSDSKSYIVTQLIGEESVSGGCQFSVSIAANMEIDTKNLGKAVCVSYELDSGKRFFSGICSTLQFTGYSKDKQQFYYQIEILDPLSLLQYKRSRQIFQNVTTKQIIEKLLEQADLKSYFHFSLSGSGKNHEYCVQLDETDQAFIQRLLANEGWHYHVRHQCNKSTVCIGDSNQRFEKIPDPKLSYQIGGNNQQHVLTTWSQSHHVGSGKVSVADHTQDLAEFFDSGTRKSTKSYASTSLTQELFAFGHENKNEVRDAAKMHMESLDLKKSASHSSSNLTTLACGYKFELTNHPLSSMNQEYIVTHLSHRLSREESNNEVAYQNQFSCIPSSLVFRPEIFDKPRVHSLHTATVTGPKGEEIYRDKWGRVKVQFHWDRGGKNDENSSCWLPVSQGFASKGFGSQFTPRIGDEVIVQYIDGDPNRPIVTGSLYNKNSAAPYSSDTQNGIKTRSTPKGSSKQGNELRFEDQKDKEQVYLHAEKDLLLDVNNDSQSTIKGIKKTQVEKSATLSVKEYIQVESDKTLTAKSKDNWTGDSEKDLSLNAASNINIAAKSTVSVDGNQVSICGKSKIELKVGTSKIEISASGIKIDAPQVSVSGKAKAEVKAAMINIEGQGKADVKAALVSVNGSAMTQIKAGAMVQIQGAITKVN